MAESEHMQMSTAAQGWGGFMSLLGGAHMLQEVHVGPADADGPHAHAHPPRRGPWR